MTKIVLAISLGMFFLGCHGCETEKGKLFLIDTDNSETDFPDFTVGTLDDPPDLTVGTFVNSISDTDDWLECKNWDPDTETYVYNNYPPGPYGFKGSVCWNEDYSVGTPVRGDTIHNICLYNSEGKLECLSQFYRSDYQIVFVDFSASWCGYCKIAADNEEVFLSMLKDKGWNATWITVLDGDGIEEAQAWKSEYNLSGSVLYNPAFIDSKTGEEKTLYDTWYKDKWYTDDGRGYPTFFIVYTANMIVWDVKVGWSPNPENIQIIVDDVVSTLEMLSEDDRLTAPAEPVLKTPQKIK